jgi:hypothetical protein
MGMKLRIQPIGFLRKAKKLMAELVALAIGFLLFGLGLWILLLRVGGFYDFVNPHSMSIGRMTVDGAENKVYAELLRARFDHHFRRPTSLPAETGFLEAATLDTPELFQPQGVAGGMQDVTLEVSGVDVTSVVRLVNKLAAPDEWVVEGDFQVRPDRALLALRLRRGARVIRTWYLDQYKPADAANDEATVKARLLEDLIDNAIFQLVYDFVNPGEQDQDLRKWRNVIKNPPPFTSPAAVSALYQAQAALASYYARGNWQHLDIAVKHLRELQGLMPEFADGLRLLGMALAEQRAESEGVHVYEQLELLLKRRLGPEGSVPAPENLRRLMQVRLLKATVKCKLGSWRSAHDAVAELTQLEADIQKQLQGASGMPASEQAAYRELLGQTAARLAHIYALYLDYLSHSALGSVFTDERAPPELRIKDAATIEALGLQSPPQVSMRIVRDSMRTVVAQYQKYLDTGLQQQQLLENDALWDKLQDGARRKTELVSLLRLASGYANYRMAEWERPGSDEQDSLFGATFETRLETAKAELAAADAAHPNHYALLQLLGLAYSEPRDKFADLSLAEHYLERARRAKPTDYTGQELRAAILLRRIVNRGVDLTSREALQEGAKWVDSVIEKQETRGAAHLLRAQFQTLLLEIETDAKRRQELRATLQQSLAQTARFLPQALRMEDPDLTWLRVVDETRRLGEGQPFDQSKKELQDRLGGLIEHCKLLEKRWVNQRRVFEIQRIEDSARQLQPYIQTATTKNWREIPIVFQ